MSKLLLSRLTVNIGISVEIPAAPQLLQFVDSTPEHAAHNGIRTWESWMAFLAPVLGLDHAIGRTP